MASTIEVPMELDMVNPTNPNFGWVNVNGPFWYSGRYRFNRFGNPTMGSGEGLSVWKINIPPNLSSPVNWNVTLHHMNASGAQGMVLLHASALVLGSGDTPTQMTVITPNKLIGVDGSGDMNITQLSQSSFDGLVPLTSGGLLQLRLKRMPLGTSGDTLLGGWDLVLPPLLRVDVI